MYVEMQLQEEELTAEQEELRRMMEDKKQYIDVKRCN